ncbi:MAG: PAS domain S-box protein [Hyphomonadaceae bacterium]|nr:PAS domain S-box protein [Hyphomonadaceae bacterium]
MDTSSDKELSAEEAREAERLRRRFWEASQDLLAVISLPDGRPRLINEPAWLRTLGYTKEELSSIRLVDLVHPEDREKTLSTRQPLESGHMLDGFENRYRAKDGAWVWLSWNVVREGDVHYAVARDITIDREARIRLAQSERQLRLMISSAVDYALFMLNPDGTVANWNAGAQRIKGYLAEEVVGRHISIFYTETDQQAGVPGRALEQAASEGRYEAETWRVRKDGTLFWANVVIDAIRDEHDALVGFAKITRDFTERKRAQLELQQAYEQLAHAQKMEALGQLTGGVAHDFNNLLAVVAGGLKLLQRTSDPARQDEIRGSMQQAVDRGARLTRQLLAFARKHDLESEPIDPAELVAEMRELLQRSLGEDIEIEIVSPPQRWMVKADPRQFELVMLNLTVNARDAMPDGGKLRISIETIDAGGEENVRLTVRDTGTGMPPDVAERAFEPFFTTKEVGKGSGLGLSQVYGFAQQANGRAWIENFPGEGVAIVIELPRTTLGPVDQDTTPDPLQKTPGEARRAAEGSVLVVEDDDSVAATVRQVLEHGGLRSHRASNAKDALAILETSSFDVVLSDIVMPGGMNGVDLARTVRQRWPGLPVILTTGYTGKADLTPNEFPVLQKPYDPDAMLALINETIATCEKARI